MNFTHDENGKVKHVETQTTDIKCNKCGKTMMVKEGRFGQFLACSGYPECKNTMNATKNENGEIVAQEAPTTDEVCELCGKPMAVKRGRYGQFLGCTGYPECKNIKKMGKDGKVTKQETVLSDEVCELCGKPMAVKRGRYGQFLGCTGYPDCKNIKKMPKNKSERMKSASVTIIGGGLAGCEAAWQLLRRGHTVHLYEMKPQKFSPAHKMEHLAELVCSNSLKSNSLDNAPGLLKEEMRRLHSLIIMAADKTAVAAGSALAVDRNQFAQEVEAQLKGQKNFTLSRIEITEIPQDSLTIIATGPLTSDALAQEIARMLGSSYLYFYDAIAPIVEADSINMDKVYWASRYDKGTPDYLNCPLTKEEYENFRQELLAGEKVAAKPFEEVRHFESCLPVEVLAARGEKTLAFGPMKPVGLDPSPNRFMPLMLLFNYAGKMPPALFLTWLGFRQN